MNEGKLEKTGGPGVFDFQPTLYNQGLLKVGAGTLRLGGGGLHNGEFNQAAGAMVTFLGGRHELETGATFTGAGMVDIDGATVAVNGTVFVRDLDFMAGAVTGPGILTLRGDSFWRGGEMNGAGSTQVDSSATLMVESGPLARTLVGRTLTNHGSLRLNGSLTLGGQATLNNMPTGQLLLQGDYGLGVTGPGQGVVHNQGLIHKTGGAGLSDIAPNIDGELMGLMRGSSGVLRLTGNGVYGGPAQPERAPAAYGAVFVTDPGARLEFAGGNHLLAGNGIFSGTGTVAQLGGSLVLSGDLDIAGSFVRTSGFFTTGLHTLNFIGSGVQTLTLQLPTTVTHMVVYTGAVVVEGAAANNVIVTGTLVNHGVLRKTLVVSGGETLAFGLTEVQLEVTTPGSLTQVQVERVDATYPGVDPARSTGRYWTITPSGGGYTASLTLPHNRAGADKLYVCRYVGPGGDADCALGVVTPATVTRHGITAFSAWTVEERFLSYLPAVMR